MLSIFLGFLCHITVRTTTTIVPYLKKCSLDSSATTPSSMSSSVLGSSRTMDIVSTYKTASDSRPLVARFLILQDLEVVKLQNRCVLFVDCGIKLAVAALSLRSSLAATPIFHFWHVFSLKKNVIFGQLHSLWMIFGLPFSPSRNTCSASPFHPRSHLDRNVWLQCTP